MTKWPLVSVVIPNHNRARHLPGAIQSALDQDPVEIEVLVCDDGSTDDSEEVVRALGDSRVRWIPGTASGGPSKPRNRGIARARGSLVAFLDSDDIWVPGKLAAQVDVLSGTGRQVCSTNAYRWVPGSGSELWVGSPSDLPLVHPYLAAEVDLAGLLRRNELITSSVVVATESVRRTGGFPEGSRPLFEDYAAWLRLANEAPVALLDEPLVVYRDKPQASYRGTLGVEFISTYNALRDFFNWRSIGPHPREPTREELATSARQLLALLAARDIPSILRGLARDLASRAGADVKTRFGSP